MRRVLFIIVILLVPSLIMAQVSGGQIKRKTQVSKSTNRASRSKNKPSKQGMTESERKTIIANIINNMVFVEGGTFMMGATPDEQKDTPSSRINSIPAHKVSLSNYYIGKFEVTLKEWEAVMGNKYTLNDALGNQILQEHYDGNVAVYTVSWNQCQEFIIKLNTLTGKTFRLPTEAEWEYAARGGKYSHGFKFSGGNDLNDVAWTNESPDAREGHPRILSIQLVGQKRPNELGIYDMTGNVSELCYDWYGEYRNNYETNPKGPSSGNRRVVRGENISPVYGGEPYTNWFYFVSFRADSSQEKSYGYVGFRLACDNL